VSAFTYKYQRRICPKWKEPVDIKGEYLYLSVNPPKAKFLSATCPIVENLRLPGSERDSKYSAYPFCNIENCLLLNDFPEFIEY